MVYNDGPYPLCTSLWMSMLYWGGGFLRLRVSVLDWRSRHCQFKLSLLYNICSCRCKLTALPRPVPKNYLCVGLEIKRPLFWWMCRTGVCYGHATFIEQSQHLLNVFCTSVIRLFTLLLPCVSCLFTVCPCVRLNSRWSGIKLVLFLWWWFPKVLRGWGPQCKGCMKISIVCTFSFHRPIRSPSLPLL